MSQLLDVCMKWKRSSKIHRRILGRMLIRIPVFYSEIVEKRTAQEELPLDLNGDEAQRVLGRILYKIQVQCANKR